MGYSFTENGVCANSSNNTPVRFLGSRTLNITSDGVVGSTVLSASGKSRGLTSSGLSTDDNNLIVFNNQINTSSLSIRYPCVYQAAKLNDGLTWDSRNQEYTVSGDVGAIRYIRLSGNDCDARLPGTWKICNVFITEIDYNRIDLDSSYLYLLRSIFDPRPIINFRTDAYGFIIPSIKSTSSGTTVIYHPQFSYVQSRTYISGDTEVQYYALWRIS